MRRFGPILMAAGLLAGLPADLPADEGKTFERLSRLQGSASLGRNREVVGASVLVRRSDDPRTLFVTATDSTGRFRVDDLPDGNYRVEVRREGLDPIVKDDVELRFPSRAVIEVLMRSAASAGSADAPPPATLPPAATSTIAVEGTVAERGGVKLPDVSLRFVRPDGSADPVVVRTSGGGAFGAATLTPGPWRLETRVVGFLPIWITVDLERDTALRVTMVPQPAGHEPTPLELMPPEQLIEPARIRAPEPRPGPETDAADQEVESSPEVSSERRTVEVSSS